MRKVFAQAFWRSVLACIWGLSGGESHAAEISGTIRYDGSLNGNIIIQAWQPKVGNRALRLDGKTGYVRTQLTDLSGPELTIQFWFKGISIQSAIRQQNGGLEDIEEEWIGRAPAVTRNPPRGWIVVGWNGFNLLSHDGLLNGLYYNSEVINEQWHHVAMTWKRNTKGGFASYMDGKLAFKRDTRNIPIPNYNAPVCFGSFNGGSEFANGLLDEISIWKRALSETEISNNWHAVLTGNEPGLVGYWSFDDNAPNDSSPNHFRGELRGAASIVDAEIPGLGSAVLSTRLNRAGYYQLTNLVAGQDYRIVAFLDVNGNGVMDPLEPRSEADQGLLRVSSKPMSLDLRLGIPVAFWRSFWFLGWSAIVSVILLGGLCWFAQGRLMRKRFEELQRHLEQQRWRIARDIHDELGAKLTRISYLSEVARCSADTAHGSELEGIGVAARELLRTLAAIVWAMTPRNDTLEHLVEYAGQYASDFFQMTGVDCQVTIPAELPNQPLASQTRHEFLRVIQESLNNILKHAGASRVGLKFEVQEFELSSTITDNGRGFDLDKVDTQRVGGGNGLRIIRERMADLGGGLRIQSAPSQGTTLYLTLPLAKRHAENSRKLAASARAFASATRGCETIAQAHPPV